MRYKTFQNAGVSVSELGIGTWGLGGGRFGAVNYQEARGAVRRMLEEGVNLIDTAPAYGNGTSEKVVGEMIKEIPRDKILVSTKFGSVPDCHKKLRRDASYRNVMREVESSLLNLKTDYIDFYFLHWPDPATTIDETLAALNLLKKEGKIRFIGVSNFDREQLKEALQYGEVDVLQSPFSMVEQGGAELMQWCEKKGIGVMTYGSMGAGILSGAIRTRSRFDPGDARNTFYDYYKEPKFSRILELLEEMDQIAERHGRTTAEVALNWSTQKSFVGTALVGVKNKEHARMNCAAFQWKLDQEEQAALDEKLEALGFGNEKGQED